MAVHGIIPARAGFTCGDVGRGRRERDHPRSRGVYPSTPQSQARRWGSSPLARGLQLGVGHATSSLGIIPARAGFTSRSRSLTSRPRDHPRSRGVYSQSTGRSTVESDHPRSRGVYIIPPISQLAQMGSSPLARGLRGFGWVVAMGVRIIPARAGFTRSPRPRPFVPPDHPRSRGVYMTLAKGLAGTAGSSPLARGLLGRCGHPTSSRGIIPARAGFTGWVTAWSVKVADHPRSRGVYGWCGKVCVGGVGSSPLARGLLVSVLLVTVLCWIIPARAGFTLPEPLTPGQVADHPRSRGVYLATAPP